MRARTVAGPSALALAAALAGCGASRDADRQQRATHDRLPALVADASPPPTADADRDADLTRRVRRAIEADATLAPLAAQLTVVTLDGGVTLRGDVRDPEQRRRLAEVARAVPGVREVRAF